MSFDQKSFEQNQSEIIFVSGIDTDVGKTIATGFYAKQLMQQGKRVITQKLVQTGCQGIAEDILKHRQIQGIELLEEDHQQLTCRYVYAYPCSPHLAARMDNRPLDLMQISQDTQRLAAQYDVVLVEGAGGLAVPLNDELALIDYIQQQGYPLILVTSGKLGSINHTLLSLEVCKNRGIDIKAVIYNQYPQKDPLIEQETMRYLQDYLARFCNEAEWIVLPVCK